MGNRHVRLRDSTLREGLDTPGVSFSDVQRQRIAQALERAGVSEAEVVAPARVAQDLTLARSLRSAVTRVTLSGLVYGYAADLHTEITASARELDRFDLLMPVAAQRRPTARSEKIARLQEGLRLAREHCQDVGAGFPHATQVPADFLLEIAGAAVAAGATRLTVYDTNGSADPFMVHELVGRLRDALTVPIFFHAHNDLGLATANAVAAAMAGASGLDVTVNGLGDRAGNASLEQVVMALHLRDVVTQIALPELKPLSAAVERESGVPVSGLAPVVGGYTHWHRSRSHLAHPELFEAFDPALLGTGRHLDRS
jgi:homocitrate synthase NifV